MNPKNKSVLITGASRGLGRALALELASRGAHVAITARHPNELHQVEKEIRSRGHVAFAIPMDISDKKAIHPLVAQASELAGPIDILINNASNLGPVPLRLLSDTDCEDLEAVLETNLVGPFRLTKAVLGSMMIRGTGVVVNVSSDAAVAAYPTWGAYSVSKSALDHLTRVWAEEMSPTSVRFLSIDPGEMDTQMHADAIPDADRAALLQPSVVALRIVSMIENIQNIPSGSRLISSKEGTQR